MGVRSVFGGGWHNFDLHIGTHIGRTGQLKALTVNVDHELHAGIDGRWDRDEIGLRSGRRWWLFATTTTTRRSVLGRRGSCDGTSSSGTFGGGQGCHLQIGRGKQGLGGHRQAELLAGAAVHGAFAPDAAFSQLNEKVLAGSYLQGNDHADLLGWLLACLFDGVGTGSLGLLLPGCAHFVLFIIDWSLLVGRCSGWFVFCVGCVGRSVLLYVW